VDWVRQLQIPEELREDWGYAEITPEVRSGILGLNLARLTGIDTTRRAPRQGDTEEAVNP
jgi:hypothetical protein